VSVCAYVWWLSGCCCGFSISYHHHTHISVSYIHVIGYICVLCVLCVCVRVVGVCVIYPNCSACAASTTKRCVTSHLTASEPTKHL